MTKSLDRHCVIYYIFIVFGGSLRCGSTSDFRRACHQRSNHHHHLKNHPIVPIRTLFSNSLSIEMPRSKISKKYSVRIACAVLTEHSRGCAAAFTRDFRSCSLGHVLHRTAATATATVGLKPTYKQRKLQ